MNPNWSPGWKVFYVILTLALFGLVMWVLAQYVIGPGVEWSVARTSEAYGVPGLVALLVLFIGGPLAGHYFVNVRGSRAAKQDVLPPRPGS
jgi:hypothetical protein